MNTRNEHAIKMIQAENAGECVQCRWKWKRAHCEWDTKPKQEDWNFMEFEYRVEPEPAEYWVNIYEGNSVAVHATKEKAVMRANVCAALRTAVHMREVTDE